MLLPNATVAKVLARVTVEAIADAPEWLAGQIFGTVEGSIVISPDSAGSGKTVAANSKIVVLKALGGRRQCRISRC